MKPHSERLASDNQLLNCQRIKYVTSSARVARLALRERSFQDALNLSQVFQTLLDFGQKIFDQLLDVAAARNIAAFA